MTMPNEAELAPVRERAPAAPDDGGTVVDLSAFISGPSRLSHASLMVSVLVLLALLVWAYAARIQVGVDVDGVVRPYGEAIPVSFQSAGEVTEMSVAEGDHVSAGQLLARLDNRFANSQFAESATRLRQAVTQLHAIDAALTYLNTDSVNSTIDPERLPESVRAAMSALETSLALARHDRDVADSALNVERALAARGFASHNDSQAAVSAVQRATLQLRSLRAAGLRDLTAQEVSLRDEVEQLRADSARAILAADNMTLRAPVSGFVSNLAIRRAGQFVQAGAPLLRVVPDSTPLVIEATVSPPARSRMAVGQAAEIQFDVGDNGNFFSIPGTVARIAPDAQFDSSGRPIGYRIVVRIGLAARPNMSASSPRIEPGMTATLKIITARERVLTLIGAKVRNRIRTE